MKPAERVLEVDSTLTGERVGMGIDTAALSHIMSVLTDLYSDPELAIIREYSTNALDAHKVAGNPLPIEVTTPTALSPFFRVRDYGDGLDAEDIRSIYSRYGTSTKRGSDDVVGMLGLGCKSALSYTDQFTLIGTKDGRTVQVSVSRDEDGGGSMTIVSDEATPNAPSGTEVIVPTKRGNYIEEKAASFFRFWTPGSVLVDGKEPAHVSGTPKATWLIPNRLLILPVVGYGTHPSPGWVVMGNVAYPMPEDASQNHYGRKFLTVAFVDIGEVNFTPSREALQLTKRTKEALAHITAETQRTLAESLQKHVEAAPNATEAAAIAQTAGEFGVQQSVLTYRGRAVPSGMKRAGDGRHPGYLLWRDRGRKSGDVWHEIPLYGSDRMYFRNFQAQAFSSSKEDKLRAWCSEKGLVVPGQVICVTEFDADEKFWLEGVEVYDWDEVQAMKVAKDDTVGSGYRLRPTGSYEMRLAGAWGNHCADEIPSGTVVTFPGNKYAAMVEVDTQRYNTREVAIPGTVTIVCLPANRRTKFQRDFPNAVTLAEYRAAEARKWAAAQDPEQLRAAWYQLNGGGRGLKGLDPTRIDDPYLRLCVTLQNTPVGTAQHLALYKAHLSAPTDLPPTGWGAPYPLISANYPSTEREHVYLYVNAAYAARQKETPA